MGQELILVVGNGRTVVGSDPAGPDKAPVSRIAVGLASGGQVIGELCKGAMTQMTDPVESKDENNVPVNTYTYSITTQNDDWFDLWPFTMVVEFSRVETSTWL